MQGFARLSPAWPHSVVFVTVKAWQSRSCDVLIPVPALFFRTQLRSFTQSLPFAWLPMVCLMTYWSYSDLCWHSPPKLPLGRDSFSVLAAREISLLILAAPGEGTASTSLKDFLWHPCFFTGCSVFISVSCIWSLLSDLIRKLLPSLI